MSITRISPGSRMSEAVIHGSTIYLSGQVGAPGESVTKQTAAILAEIEMLLEQAGSSRQHLLMAQIWLADMSDFAEMNVVWDAWISGVQPPARATGEARLANAGYKIEIIVTAARAD